MPDENDNKDTTLSLKGYVDGACSKNPGPGGWAAYIIFCLDDIEKGVPHEKYAFKISGGKPHTTNNEMELMAFYKILTFVEYPITIYTDSMYVINCFNNCNEWIQNEKDKDKPLANSWLIHQIKDILDTRGKNVTLLKVKGHSGDTWNEACDKLAKEETKKQIRRLENNEIIRRRKEAAYREKAARNIEV